MKLGCQGAFQWKYEGKPSLDRPWEETNLFPPKLL